MEFVILLFSSVGSTITYDIAPSYSSLDDHSGVLRCTLGSTFVSARGKAKSLERDDV